jgi:hypothetical protein
VKYVLFSLLVLLVSLCGPATEGNVESWHSSLAAKTTANANRIAGVRAVDDFIAQAEANGMVVRVAR